MERMDQSKLAMARREKGLDQEKLAEAINVDASTISRWEKGETMPRASHLQKLCTFFGKSANELGLDGGDKVDRVVLPINTACKTLARDPVTRLFHLAYLPLCSYQEVHRKMTQILSEGTMNTTRREILIGALHGLVGLPLATGVLHGSQYEAILRRCTAAIAACWELMKSTEADDLRLAFEGVSAYLPILDVIAKEVPQLRQTALDLATRSAILKTLLGWHRKGYAAAIQYGQEAITYSDAYNKETGDILLQLSARSKLAWSYYYCYGNSNSLALETAQEAQNILEKSQNREVHPCVRGQTYCTLALMQANQHIDADTALGKATELDPGNENVALMEFTRPDIPRQEGLIWCLQDGKDQQGKARASLEKLIDPKTLLLKVPQGGGAHQEIINLLARVSLRSKDRDIDEIIHIWTTGIEKAKALRSEKGFAESIDLYNFMSFVWPHEPRITELRDLIQHW